MNSTIRGTGSRLILLFERVVFMQLQFPIPERDPAAAQVRSWSLHTDGDLHLSAQHLDILPTEVPSFKESSLPAEINVPLA